MRHWANTFLNHMKQKKVQYGVLHMVPVVWALVKREWRGNLTCWTRIEKTNTKKSSRTHIILLKTKNQLQVQDILRLKLQCIHSLFSAEMQNEVTQLYGGTSNPIVTTFMLLFQLNHKNHLSSQLFFKKWPNLWGSNLPEARLAPSEQEGCYRHASTSVVQRQEPH